MMKNYTKKHILGLKPSATLPINEKSKKLESEGKKIINFGFGQSPFPIPEKIVESLRKNAHKKDYLPVHGLPELRKAISKYINLKISESYSEDNIIVGQGSKQLMFLLHIGFDGEFIFPTSSWVSYEPQAIIGNNKVHWIETSRENNWFPSPEQIEKKIKEIKNKKLILVLNSPNNPSGTTCKNFEEIAKVAKKYKIIILSDEIYSELKFDGKYDSVSKYYPEGTIISSGLSKWCGAGGWRLGFFVIPKNLKDIFNFTKVLSSESVSSITTPIQYAAVDAFSGDYSDYLSKVRHILNSVGNYVHKNLKSNKILISPPEGGFYLMPEFLHSKFKTSQDMCDDILNSTGVSLLPGSDFGFQSNKMLARLSFTDFDGTFFLKNIDGSKKLDDDIIKRYAPNVVEGTKRLSQWSKSL